LVLSETISTHGFDPEKRNLKKESLLSSTHSMTLFLRIAAILRFII
jgi:hypothetical protein